MPLGYELMRHCAVGVLQCSGAAGCGWAARGIRLILLDNWPMGGRGSVHVLCIRVALRR